MAKASGSGNFYSSLKGIPIDYLVAAPLLAACRANIALAEAMEEFVFAIGYQGGDPSKGANLITFKLERPYTDPDSGELKKEDITVQAPLIGLVPIPALLVDNVTVDFTTTVSTTAKSSSTAKINLHASYGYGLFQIGGSVSANISRMRSSNQSGTYTFHVQADQQPATEGMGQLMDVMAQCTGTVPTGGS